MFDDPELNVRELRRFRWFGLAFDGVLTLFVACGGGSAIFIIVNIIALLRDPDVVMPVWMGAITVLLVVFALFEMVACLGIVWLLWATRSWLPDTNRSIATWLNRVAAT